MNRQELEKKVRYTVIQLIGEKGYVSPLELLLKMEEISPKFVEEWRFGRVPYLERGVERRYSTHYVKYEKSQNNNIRHMLREGNMAEGVNKCET